MSSKGAGGMVGTASSSAQYGMIGADPTLSLQYGITNGPCGFNDSEMSAVFADAPATSTVEEAGRVSFLALGPGKTLKASSS